MSKFAAYGKVVGDVGIGWASSVAIAVVAHLWCLIYVSASYLRPLRLSRIMSFIETSCLASTSAPRFTTYLQLQSSLKVKSADVNKAKATLSNFIVNTVFYVNKCILRKDIEMVTTILIFFRS